jgi:hypothetical protein
MKEQIKPRIVRGETQLIVPHQKGQLAAIYPVLGPDNYRNLGNEILKRKQLVPTGDFTASLLHSTYCDQEVKNEPETKQLRDIMKNNYFYVFNNNLWTPKGVYVVQDPEAIGISQPLNENDLEKMLKGGKDINGIRFSKDKKVRFAPKESYKLGEHTAESLSKDGFVIASCNVNGAEKLGEVSSTFKNNPFIFGLEIKEDQKSKQRVSGLGSSWGGRGLDFGGDCFGDGTYGFAFGVRR